MSGSTFGEAIVPVLIGVVMNRVGASILPYTMMFISLLLTCLYLAVHGLFSIGWKDSVPPSPTTATTTTTAIGKADDNADDKGNTVKKIEMNQKCEKFDIEIRNI